MNNTHSIWTEKYRPTAVEEYISTPDIVDRIKGYIASGDIPHLLLYSKHPGTGKTTLAKMLVKNIDCDYLYINASSDNSIDIVREKIIPFASTFGINSLKVVILDEFDFMSANAMAGLRNAMETYAKSTRFILTCNYVEKVIDPIISRCQVYHLVPPSKADYAKRLAFVLKSEGVTFTREDIVVITNVCYPDLRRGIGECQKFTVNGELKLTKALTMQGGYQDMVVDWLKNPKAHINDVRQIIADSSVKQFTELYRHLFDTMEWVPTAKVPEYIITIADYMYKDSVIVDKEINLIACLQKLYEQIHYKK